MALLKERGQDRERMTRDKAKLEDQTNTATDLAEWYKKELEKHKSEHTNCVTLKQREADVQHAHKVEAELLRIRGEYDRMGAELIAFKAKHISCRGGGKAPVQEKAPVRSAPPPKDEYDEDDDSAIVMRFLNSDEAQNLLQRPAHAMVTRAEAQRVINGGLCGKLTLHTLQCLAAGNTETDSLGGLQAAMRKERAAEEDARNRTHALMERGPRPMSREEVDGIYDNTYAGSRAFRAMESWRREALLVWRDGDQCLDASLSDFLVYVNAYDHARMRSGDAYHGNEVRFEHLTDEQQKNAHDNMRLFIKFKVNATGLKHQRVFATGKIEPWMDIYMERSNNSWIKVCSTEVQDNENPCFEVIASSFTLCGGEPNRRLKFAVWDHNMHGTWEGPFMIGEFVTSLAQMQKGCTGKEVNYPIINPDARAKDRDSHVQGVHYIDSGKAFFTSVELVMDVTPACTSLHRSRLLKDDTDFLLHLDIEADLRNAVAKGQDKNVNPVMELYAYGGPNAAWKRVFVTPEAIKERMGDEDASATPILSQPKWRSFSVSTSQLCNLDFDQPVLIQMWHYYDKQRSKFLGYVETTVRNMVSFDDEVKPNGEVEDKPIEMLLSWSGADIDVNPMDQGTHSALPAIGQIGRRCVFLCTPLD